MENNDNCDSRTFSQEFYFYPRIFSNRYHRYELSRRQLVWCYIKTIPKLLFYVLKKVCYVVFRNKFHINKNYVGDVLDMFADKLWIGSDIVFRIMMCFAFLFLILVPSVSIITLIVNCFIYLPALVMDFILLGCFFIFMEALWAVLMATEYFYSAKKEILYACCCNTKQNSFHWSINPVSEKDRQNLPTMYPVEEVKFSDVHDQKLYRT